MKVIKVIVDELPVNCSSCRWWEHGAYTGFQVLCGLAVREIDTEKLSTRPDWCPLINKTDVLEWALIEDGWRPVNQESEDK
jgi:hypothetical protein